MRLSGIVKWFNAERGYGFIIPNGSDRECFVHYSYILMDGYKTLRAGQPVTFELKKNEKGIQAHRVVRKLT